MRHVFDDDLHPTHGIAYPYGSLPMPPDGPDRAQMGAGPIVTLSGGTPDDNIGATMSLPDPPVYDDPELQFNSDNETSGDMLSGLYHPGTSHAEASNYPF